MPAMQRFLSGWRGLVTGEQLNQIVDRVNGTIAGIYTGTFNGILGAITPAAASVTDLSQNGVLTRGVQRATAAGSNSQANATPITKSMVMVATVSATTRAVRLPAAATGKQVHIQNCAGTGVKVYPATGDRIGAAATNAVGAAIIKRKGSIYTAQDATTWEVLVGA